MGCTGIVITGGLVEGGGALIAKNSDTGNNKTEVPIHRPRGTVNLTYATSASTTKTESLQTYAFTGCDCPSSSDPSTQPLGKLAWGMNERGVSAFYTQLSGINDIQYANPNGLKLWGRDLVTMFLAFYDNVEDILADLINDASKLGSNNRYPGHSVAVVDRFGTGVVIEVGVQKVVWKRVYGYFVENNAVRMWDLNPQSTLTSDATNIRPETTHPRTIYIKAAVDEVIAAKGTVNAKDMVQKVIRYIQHKENAPSTLYINVQDQWDIINDGTASSYVGKTGDLRYNGKLNCLWGEYGNPAIISIYELHIPFAGAIPLNGAGSWGTGMPATSMRRYVDNDGGGNGAGGLRDYAGNNVIDPFNPYPTTRYIWEYDAVKVREIQAYVFPTENYTLARYEEMLQTIPSNLNETDLAALLKTLVDHCQTTATSAYINKASPRTLNYRSTPINTNATIDGVTITSPSTRIITSAAVTIQTPKEIQT